MAIKLTWDYLHFTLSVRVNQKADEPHNRPASSSPLPDRDELIKLAEEEVLAIETQYEKSISAAPTVELSDISEITEQTNKLLTDPSTEETHL